MAYGGFVNLWGETFIETQIFQGGTAFPGRERYSIHQGIMEIWYMGNTQGRIPVGFTHDTGCSIGVINCPTIVF